MLNRRAILALLGLVAGFATMAPVTEANAQDASMLELGVPSPVGDLPLGAADAKVTIYEYASYTCSHCGEFHKETYPELKKLYIDTGKVRYIRREMAWPTDPLARGATMLARCSGPEKYQAVSDMLFKFQEKWTFTPNPLDNLRALMRQTGMSDTQFNACVQDTGMAAKVAEATKRGGDVLKVDSTPTFFINGKRLVGARPIADFQQAIDAALVAAK